MSKVQRSLVGNENKVLFTVKIIRQFIFSWNVLNVWYWTTKYKMHLKLGARIENRMLARICHLWSLSVNVDLFDHSEAFSLVKRKGTQKTRHYLHVLYLFNLSLKTPNAVRSGKKYRIILKYQVSMPE